MKLVANFSGVPEKGAFVREIFSFVFQYNVNISVRQSGDVLEIQGEAKKIHELSDSLDFNLMKYVEELDNEH